MLAKFGIFREHDNTLMEGGFFSRERAEEYCRVEYNEPAAAVAGYDGVEFYVVRPQ